MVIKTTYESNSFRMMQRPWTPTKRRGPIAAEHYTPGPASVALPSTIGTTSHDSVSSRSKSPAFSFGGRHPEKRENFVPGPGTYSIKGLCHTGRETVCAPTLSGRTKKPEPFKTPAPGAYSPEKSDKTVLGGLPSYSFGIKGKDQKLENFPAPNSYRLPTSVGNGHDSVNKKSPAYSMGAKCDDIFPVTGKYSPGPGKYNTSETDAYKSKSPAFSLSGRTNIPGDKTQKPGPGAHSPEKAVKQQLPAYSFGIRHSPHAYNIAPRLH